MHISYVEQLFVLSFLFFSYSLAVNSLNAPDLPYPPSNVQTIPKGSLVIPMSPNLQALDPGTGLMSVLPYGLVIRTLHANISVWWAINTGKAMNGADFIAKTQNTTFGNIMTRTSPNVSDSTLWGAAQTVTYAGGPFIILQKDAQNAFNNWKLWNTQPSSYYLTVDKNVYSTVAIHILLEDTQIDIRHKIYTRPQIGISNLDGNAPTQTGMMGCIYQNKTRQCPLENGYGEGGVFGNGMSGCKAFQPQDHAGLDWGVHYLTYDCGADIAALTSTTCLTTFSEPHWEWYAATGPSYLQAMKNFIFSGANFFVQCASIQSYEDEGSGVTGTGTFLTTYGIQTASDNGGIQPGGAETESIYPDLPVMQFIGTMTSKITGAVSDFYNLFGTGSSDKPPKNWTIPQNGPSPAGDNNFQTLAFPLVTNLDIGWSDTSSPYYGRNTYVAAGAKYSNSQLGSNVWYLGGHTWVGQSINGSENGRRFFFNAMLVPAARPPACGFTFCNPTDVCAPQDACHTCACQNGTSFVQTPIPNCCLNNAGCAANGVCSQCNPSTNQCVGIAGCCTSTSQCAACHSCVNNVCQPTAGCCTQDSDCGTSPCVHCNVTSRQCYTQPETQCCDLNLDPLACSSSPCEHCVSNQCTRISPVTSCCLANSDCGNSPCQICNNNTRQCQTVPGCCNVNSDCGTDPCIECLNNACATKSGCCTSNAQCGTCSVCNNENVCVADNSQACCTTDADCGSCRRCESLTGTTSTCVLITQCCSNNADCEVCQQCSNQQCVPVPGCCRFTSDCVGTCQICQNFACVNAPSTQCCWTDNDQCNTYAEQESQDTSCDWTCVNPENPPTSNQGQCQQKCSSSTNNIPLIVGLAVGIPGAFGLLALIGAGLAALLYKNSDTLRGKLGLKKSFFPDSGCVNNPEFQPKHQVVTSQLNS